MSLADRAADPAVVPVCVNVGCGPKPTPGWLNLDNSPSVALARAPDRITRSLRRLGLVSREQLSVVEAARRAGIRRATATRMPFPAQTVDVIYSSHMLEHLDREAARR